MLRVTLLAFALLATAGALDICGNFCGPTWCDGKAITECPVGGKVRGRTAPCIYPSSSTASMPFLLRISLLPQSCERDANTCTESGPTDGSCADECCKMHDTCCGSDDRSACNANIIKCLKACPSGPGSKGQACHRGSLPVPVDAVLVGMELDPYGCCGTSCDGSGKAPKAAKTEKEALAAVIEKAVAPRDEENPYSASSSYGTSGCAQPCSGGCPDGCKCSGFICVKDDEVVDAPWGA